ncbi:MAG: Ig-like domain-containing protein [Odoribacter sp.]|nr:Ig-like domain-containing protein [Odoribacter sp.]
MRSRLRILPVAIAMAVLGAACASIGRPEGGPRDENPPVFVRSTPMPGQLEVNQTSFSLYFDENVQLEDAFNKVVVSPVQLSPPSVSANGRRVTVTLRDTLVPDMTYTIDFGDAIKDLNEGNVIDGFALDFSTGGNIDTLRLSGIVLDASNLEPAQGILVGAYSNTADSAIHTLPPARIARTNQLGQFTIRNLAPGAYRVYALNDINRDYHWDRSEDVAFLDTLITPGVQEIMVVDTLYDSNGGDSLITRPGLRYVPNDILLTWFNENYRAQYLKDYRRDDRRRASIVLGAPPDSLPKISIVGTVLNGMRAENWAVPQYNATRDSLVLWLRDSAALFNDSLMLAVSYRRPDSLEQLYWHTDTLRFFYRPPQSKKKSDGSDTIPPKYDLLQIGFGGATSQDVHLPLMFNFNQPVEHIDTTGIHLRMMVDTLWVDQPLPPIQPDSLTPLLGRTITPVWQPGAKYRFEIDSAAVTGIYGEHNPAVKREFSVRQLEDYSNLIFNLNGADSTAIVELLNGSDAPVASAQVKNGRAVFNFMNPGTYYARLYFDIDGNRKWSTGILDSVQPEEVAYYPKKIELKKNWDVEQDWDIYELPIDKQKPRAILKNKPKLKRGEQESHDENEVDEDPLLGFPGTTNEVDRRRRQNNLNTGGRNTQVLR